MAANSADIIARFTKATGLTKRVNPVTGEPETDPVTGKMLIPKLTLSPTKAARTIIESMDLRTADEDLSEKEAKIWRYDGSVWSPDGGKEIKDTIYKAIDDLAYEKGVRETLHQVRARIKTASFDKEPFLFPALDGTIDLRTGMFREARPEDYLTFQY